MDFSVVQWAKRAAFSREDMQGYSESWSMPAVAVLLVNTNRRRRRHQPQLLSNGVRRLPALSIVYQFTDLAVKRCRRRRCNWWCLISPQRALETFSGLLRAFIGPLLPARILVQPRDVDADISGKAAPQMNGCSFGVRFAEAARRIGDSVLCGDMARKSCKQVLKLPAARTKAIHKKCRNMFCLAASTRCLPFNHGSFTSLVQSGAVRRTSATASYSALPSSHHTSQLTLQATTYRYSTECAYTRTWNLQT